LADGHRNFLILASWLCPCYLPLLDLEGGIPLQTYELLEIVNPALGAEAVKAHTDKVDELIRKNGGEVTHRNEPVRKKLGHLMKKNADGVFCITQFKAPTAAIKEMTRVLNLDQESLRHQVTIKKPVKAKAPKARKVVAAQ